MFIVLGIFFYALSFCRGIDAVEFPENAQDMQPGVIYVVRPVDEKESSASSIQLSSNQATKVENFMPCQCYCSDLCDMRARKADDTPFVDPETGICFCKQRDKDNYIPHGCGTKPQPVVKPELGPSCCGK